MGVLSFLHNLTKAGPVAKGLGRKKHEAVGNICSVLAQSGTLLSHVGLPAGLQGPDVMISI